MSFRVPRTGDKYCHRSVHSLYSCVCHQRSKQYHGTQNTSRHSQKYWCIGRNPQRKQFLYKVGIYVHNPCVPVRIPGVAATLDIRNICDAVMSIWFVFWTKYKKDHLVSKVSRRAKPVSAQGTSHDTQSSFPQFCSTCT